MLLLYYKTNTLMQKEVKVGYQFSSDKPIFEQIIDNIVVKIASGIYQENERLLSVRDYAVEFGVNPNITID